MGRFEDFIKVQKDSLKVGYWTDNTNSVHRNNFFTFCIVLYIPMFLNLLLLRKQLDFVENYHFLWLTFFA